MSRRGRAVGFLIGALAAAAAAAAIADGYGRSVARGYGALRPVLVATGSLRAGEEIDLAAASELLEVRRVPVRFVPATALATHRDALGLVPRATIPAGSYLLAGQLRPPRPAGSGAALGHGRRPVEIAVSGAGALTAFGGQPVGSRVDVVVTTEPSGSGEGRTYVAAPAVPLLALSPAPSGETGEAVVTLGLSRSQALRLIAAQSFARRVTVLPGG